TRRGDPANRPTLGEPEVAVGAGRDPMRLTIARREREIRDDAGRSDPTNQAPCHVLHEGNKICFDMECDEPEVAVGAGRVGTLRAGDLYGRRWDLVKQSRQQPSPFQVFHLESVQELAASSRGLSFACLELLAVGPGCDETRAHGRTSFEWGEHCQLGKTS